MDDVKLALSMIMEEHEPIEFVKRAIESVEKYVQGIFVTVTYKKKEPTKSALVAFLKSKNISVSFFKWTKKFDDARNFATKQIPKDFLYYIWMDADDVWQNPQVLPQLVREAYLYNHSAVFLEYYYLVELDERGDIREILIQHKRERIIRNDDTFAWKGRLHETLIEQRQANVVKTLRTESAVVHLTNEPRSIQNLSRNIEILEAAIAEEQRKDPRTLMYLGKAYFDRGKFAEADQKKIDFDLAETLFQEYLQGDGSPGIDYKPGSGWSEERSSAWEYLSEIYRLKNNYNMAIKANANALIEAPQYPNYYLDMAMNYVLKKEHDKAETWLFLGRNVPIPATTLILTPRDLKARTLELEYHIGIAKMDLDRACKASEMLVELFPNNEAMRKRLEDIQNLVILNKVGQSIVYVGKYLEGTNQAEKIIPLLQSVPQNLQHENFVSQMRHRFLPARLWKNDEIAIVCGGGFEKWSPKSSLEKGIGGSEAAVIYQARELTKLGYKVTVFGDPQDEAGEYEGVTYKQWHDLNTKDTFNILILWRSIGIVDANLYAKQTYLWMHDVPNCSDLTEQRLAKINKIFVLSQYHRSLFKMAKNGDFVDIPDDKFFITRNGIELYFPKENLARDPYRMIYASSYDRGLAHLLALWPEIKKEVPKANLRVFYGWNMFDVIAQNNPERAHWKQKMIQMMKQEGIEECGRVGHEELAQEFSKSGIFAYPCDFQEISCQNAMQAQVYGAIPVVTDYSALKETVQFGKKVDTDVTSMEGKEVYVKELISALKDQEWQEKERAKMMQETKGLFLWSDVARAWKELFEKEKVSGVQLITVSSANATFIA